jgi:hypothetical protein
VGEPTRSETMLTKGLIVVGGVALIVCVIVVRASGA